MLVRVLYVSTIASDLGGDATTRLVASAQRRNRQLDLTGALLKCDGHFAQVLEGRDEDVSDMIARIAADPRNSDLHMTDCGQISRRVFSDWDMAFLISSECGSDVLGYLDKTVTPEQFVKAMVRHVEDRKLAPY